MVIVWGHGRGFAPRQSSDLTGEPRAEAPATPDTPSDSGVLRGIAADKTQHTYLDTPLLRDTLQAVVQEDLSGRPFDIYASDACLMQSIEVATELAGVARFIVGSAQIQPFTGLPYRQLLHELNSGRLQGQGDADADEAYLIARQLPALAADAMHGDGLPARLAPSAVKTFTLSALRSSELRNNLVPALHEVGRRLSASITAVPLRAVQLGQHIQNMPSFLGGATDIGYFLERLKDALLVSGSCHLDSRSGAEVIQCSDAPTTLLLGSLTRAQQALSATVISAAFGEDYLPPTDPTRMLGFAALSVYLPRSQRDYHNRIHDYATATFYQPSATTDSQVGPWRDWLDKIFAPH
jgi:hypothetical protein